jgi:SNF family Na+-dependent transporter
LGKSIVLHCLLPGRFFISLRFILNDSLDGAMTRENNYLNLTQMKTIRYTFIAYWLLALSIGWMDGVASAIVKASMLLVALLYICHVVLLVRQLFKAREAELFLYLMADIFALLFGGYFLILSLAMARAAQ